MGDILQNKIQDADFLGRDVAGVEGNVAAGQIGAQPLLPGGAATVSQAGTMHFPSIRIR